ncbi:helix-turn-helix transcriptional regulator [Bradyrhizobium ottawaense]|uniref:helix-turn-helix transcriptional regulator n=1 Tax=Bradyrhizobium ottawaense TaxID=931866 RepID=UPI0038350B89
MHRLFQSFVDRLSSAEAPEHFSEAMALIARTLELSCFAYLALPETHRAKPRLISTYPSGWTSHYLDRRYQRIDPVVLRALQSPEPFRWGSGIPFATNSVDQEILLNEAREFGISFGFTVPVHDGHGPIAAVTFASAQRNAAFDNCIRLHTHVLQLMAMFFHAHVRRKLGNEHNVAGVLLSPREFECLEWASQGKSAWEIGCILGISRNTVAYYLENAKEKLGVRTVVQAVTLLAAVNKRKQN